MKNYRAIVFILSIFGTNFFCLAASTLRDKSVAFIDNKEVISGKLRNGLQYHLIPNAKAEKRISLRLCVKA